MRIESEKPAEMVIVSSPRSTCASLNPLAVLYCKRPIFSGALRLDATCARNASGTKHRTRSALETRCVIGETREQHALAPQSVKQRAKTATNAQMAKGFLFGSSCVGDVIDSKSTAHCGFADLNSNEPSLLKNYADVVGASSARKKHTRGCV